jgi:hypothetical protein
MPRRILRFLASVGRRAEAELYLSLFRAERPESFSLIAVDPDVMGAPGDHSERKPTGQRPGTPRWGIAAEALAVDLEFLAELRLTPVLAVESTEQARWLADWLGARGEVIDAPGAADAARRGVLPICALAPAEVPALVAALATRKVVLLGPTGAISRTGELLSIIDITSEAAELLAPGILPDPDRALLIRARALLDAAPHNMTVAITSPLELLRELFTVRGAGTLVRRGAAVRVHAGWDQVDRARLVALIEAAFGRPLVPGFLDRPVERIYLAGDYRGAAIIEPTAQGPYLSKLAVDAQARGEGIARDLWRALARDYASLYWRSRPRNPIAPWYQEQCDGMIKLADWQIYWRGLAPDAIPGAIRAALEAPPDL